MENGVNGTEGMAPAVASGSQATADQRERGQRRTWLGVLLTVLVAGGGVGFLLYDSLDSAQFYKTIPEVQAERTELAGQRFRVAGRVVPNSLMASTGGAARIYHFRLTDQGQELAVRYDRALPDSFTDGVEVVVEGGLLPSGEFQAVELIARCPSKYEAEWKAGGGSPMGSGSPVGHPTELPRTTP